MFLGYDATCVETVFSSDTQYRFQTIKRLKNKKFCRCPMANIKSAKKRVLVSQAKADRNKSARSKVKTYIKKVESAVAAGDKAAAQAAVVEAESVMRKAASKGVYHDNTVSRKISRMNKAVNAMN